MHCIILAPDQLLTGPTFRDISSQLVKRKTCPEVEICTSFRSGEKCHFSLGLEKEESVGADNTVTILNHYSLAGQHKGGAGDGGAPPDVVISPVLMNHDHSIILQKQLDHSALLPEHCKASPAFVSLSKICLSFRSANGRLGEGHVM